MSDLNFDNDTATDFDMDQVEDLPQYVREIDGVYSCDLSLSRDTGEKDGKPYDYLIMTFILIEEIEARKDHGVSMDDIVVIRNSLMPTKRDVENKERTPLGVKIAKPYLMVLKEALNTSGALNDIITNAQGVKCTATFATKHSKGQNKDGETVEYANINLKKLVVA